MIAQIRILAAVRRFIYGFIAQLRIFLAVRRFDGLLAQLRISAAQLGGLMDC